MEENDQAVEQGHIPPTQAKSRLASYNFLLNMSKRMGVVATRSFVEVREFLNKDITMTPSERFLSGMPKLKLQDREGVSNKTGKSGTNNEGELDTKSSGESSSSGTGLTDGQKEGQDEKEKDVAEGENKIDVASNDLEKIITQSHEVLAQANTVFPITLFPDTVLVDRTKVTIIKRDFFWSSDTMTFRIEDVLNAEVTVGPIFGSLTIASRVMSTTDHFRIDHFWRNDAIYLKRIIQGYIIAQHNKIDVAHLTKEKLIKTLNELGHHQSN